MRTVFAMLTVLTVAMSAHGEVFSSEFSALPSDEGWELVAPSCGVSGAIENGHYVQRLDPQNCPEGAQETYARTTGSFFGTHGLFLEYRVRTDGDASEACEEWPVVINLSFFGSDYLTIVMADGQAVFLDYFVIPPLILPLPPAIAHTVRLEWSLENGNPHYVLYVDDLFRTQEPADWVLLFNLAQLKWSGTACVSPIENRWDYIRYGDIPADGSGDFDSDGHVDGRDYYFFEDCFSRRDPGQDDGPGCLFADMTGDTAVDLADFAQFQTTFDLAARPRW